MTRSRSSVLSKTVYGMLLAPGAMLIASQSFAQQQQQEVLKRASSENFFQVVLGEYLYTSGEREQQGGGDIEISSSEMSQPVNVTLQVVPVEDVKIRPTFRLQNNESGNLELTNTIAATFEVMNGLNVGGLVEIQRFSAEAELPNGNKAEVTNNSFKLGPLARYEVALGDGGLDLTGSLYYYSSSDEQSNGQQQQAVDLESSGFGIAMLAEYNYPIAENVLVNLGAGWSYQSGEAEDNNLNTDLDESEFALVLRPIGVRMLF